MMHAGRFATCDRLKRVHALLADGGEHSTLEIGRAMGVCAVNSIVAELRANGAVIDCRQAIDPRTRRRRWYYRMLAPVPEAAAA